MSVPQRLNRSPEGKMQLLNEHLIYEIKMLRIVYEVLQVSAFSVAVGNALIESFCIHARNLIEFFDETYPENGKKACAQHFATKFKSSLRGKFDDRLLGKLHEQIAHLSYGRSQDAADKINSADRDRLLKALNEEIEIFSMHLKDVYRKVWHSELKEIPNHTHGVLAHTTTTSFAAQITETVTQITG